MDDEKLQKVKNYALKLLSFRPRSHNELEGKLMQYSIKRGIGAKIVGKVMSDLVSHNLVNDDEFIKWWIEQRQSFKPKGYKAIRIELVNKGVDRQLIDKVYNNIGGGKIKEFELALQIAKKRISVNQHLTIINKKIMIRNLLVRRGYDWETIYKVIDSIVKKSYNTD